MTDDRSRISDGIRIDRDVADAEAVPEDLDADVVGPYRFPDPRRRRIAGWIYLGLAGILGLWSLQVPDAWIVGMVVAGAGAWHMLAAWPLRLDQEEALEKAASLVPFAVGHASAAVTFHGLRARPRWHVVIYAADDPPSHRALVRLDAVTGAQTDEVYVEDVPGD